MPTWWWTNDILIREIRKVVLVIIFEKTLQKGGGTCIREEHMGKENRSKDAETVVNFAGIPLPSPAASIFFDEWSVLTSLTISYVRTRHTCYRLNFYLYLDYFNFWTFPAFFFLNFETWIHSKLLMRLCLQHLLLQHPGLVQHSHVEEILRVGPRDSPRSRNVCQEGRMCFMIL